MKDALALVDDKWVADFRSFVESGDASDAFFAFLDQDARCQQAVDMVLKRKSRGLERVAELLRTEEPARAAQPEPFDRSAQLARVLGITAGLPPAERYRVVREAVASATSAASDPEAVRDVAQQIVQQMDVVK